jgi:hypothetical protein
MKEKEFRKEWALKLNQTISNILFLRDVSERQHPFFLALSATIQGLGKDPGNFTG